MKPFLKRLGEHSLFTAITLLIAMATILAGFFLWDFIEPKSTYSRAIYDNKNYDVHNEIAEFFKVTDITSLKDTDNFTVTGKIINTSDNEWEYVNINIAYAVEGIKMGLCESDSLNYLKPKSEYAFTIDCNILSAKKLPSQFSYELIFVYGQERIRNP